jgi:hypothetical protein
VLPGLFVFAGLREGGGCDDVQATDNEAGEAEELSTLQSRETEGTALCRRCRFKLPANMRLPLEGIVEQEEWVVAGALRAAANYFDVHYKSIRFFRGGRVR